MAVILQVGGRETVGQRGRGGGGGVTHPVAFGGPALVVGRGGGGQREKRAAGRAGCGTVSWWGLPGLATLRLALYPEPPRLPCCVARAPPTDVIFHSATEPGRALPPTSAYIYPWLLTDYLTFPADDGK